MRLHAVDIPDDPAQLPAWLERHLVGPHLGELVAELSAVHAPLPGPVPTVEQLLAQHEPAVLEHGLAILPVEVVRQLLLQPRLLLDLQDLVCVHGGPYWMQRGAQPAGHDPMIQRGHQRLDAFLASQESSRPSEPRTIPLTGSVRWYRRPGLVSMATAAGIVLAVFAYYQYGPAGLPGTSRSQLLAESDLHRQLAEERRQRQEAEQRAQQSPAARTWGWAKPGALPENVTAAAYLNRLADGAGEWFNQRPQEAALLARRLAEFRQGCSQLVFAAHRPLAAEDRQWLVRRCRQWAAQFDKQMEALEAGEDVRQVQSAADATARQIVDALRSRAEDVAG